MLIRLLPRRLLILAPASSSAITKRAKMNEGIRGPENEMDSDEEVGWAI
jgi:hypothetical protein